jgi:hypothetical protein
MTTEHDISVPSRTAVLANTSDLAEFAALDPKLPALVLQSMDQQLKREFFYAAMSLGAGLIALLAIVGGYVYLSMNGHPVTSGVLLGAGVLGLITAIIRLRLHR